MDDSASEEDKDKPGRALPLIVCYFYPKTLISTLPGSFGSSVLTVRFFFGPETSWRIHSLLSATVWNGQNHFNLEKY